VSEVTAALGAAAENIKDPEGALAVISNLSAINKAIGADNRFSEE
jgi:hypothetical protein